MVLYVFEKPWLKNTWWVCEVKYSEAEVHEVDIYLNILNLWQVANPVVS